jgi:hypothetical protein
VWAVDKSELLFLFVFVAVMLLVCFVLDGTGGSIAVLTGSRNRGCTEMLTGISVAVLQC